jgi:cell pole-organizing protein PopZ
VVAPSETHGDLDVFAKSHDAPAPEPAPVFAAHPDDDGEDDGLVSAPAATAVASHFGALAHTIAMPEAGRTLEDVVRALLRPLLKDWLDQHLPGLVEQAVRDEVERISRRRAY